MPANNVEVVTRSLAHHFGRRPFAAPLEGVAAWGDDHGLLIVVDQRQRWFPQQRQLPWADGLRLRDAQGWELRAA